MKKKRQIKCLVSQDYGKSSKPRPDAQPATMIPSFAPRNLASKPMPVSSFMDPPSFAVCAPSGCLPQPPPPPHNKLKSMAMIRDDAPLPPPKNITSPPRFPPSLPPPPAGPTTSVERALLSRIACLEAQVERTQSELYNWRELFRKFFNTVILSPENCENFKRVRRLG